ncbi:MAG: hypothetical protein LBT81_04145 [Helicobacteraceae bacterium]|jgi:formylglycine-generating enzyme required for sulfatase activity|nr:hypothetical protein [Helicobacteraceae bacterium]
MAALYLRSAYEGATRIHRGSKTADGYIFDIFGNVFERTADWYSEDYHVNSLQNKPRDILAAVRAPCGGRQSYAGTTRVSLIVTADTSRNFCSDRAFVPLLLRDSGFCGLIRCRGR